MLRTITACLNGSAVLMPGTAATAQDQVIAGQPFACGVVARDKLKRIIGGRDLDCTGGCPAYC